MAAKSLRIVPWGVAALWLAIVWGWEVAYLTLPVDDAFYYLRIAANVGAGRGSSFDGVEVTNGYHPLWMLLLAPLSSLPLEDAALRMRWVLSLQVGLVVGGLWLLASRRPAAVTVAALLFTNVYAAKIVVNGQESALQFLLLAAALRLWWRAELSSRDRDWWLVGVVAAAASLARLEAGVFALALAATALLWPSSPAAADRRWRRGFAIAFPVGLALSSYLLANQLLFDHPLPVSGSIKLAAGSGLRLVSASAFALGLLAVLAKPPWGRDLFPLLVYAAFESVYQLAMRPLGVVEIWTLVPQLLALFLVLPELALRRWVVAVLALGYLGLTLIGWSHRLHPNSYAPYLAARESGRWLARHAEAEAVIAGWSVGIVAAHAGRDVVNLDGLVNSRRYLDDILRRGRVQHYVETERDVDYVVDYFAIPKSGDVLGPRAWLASWRVRRADCVRFENRPGSVIDLLYVVLSRRGEGELLGDLVGAARRGCESLRLRDAS